MDLQAAYGRDKGTIRKVLTDAGATIRPRGNPKGTVWSPERREAHRKATGTPEFAQKSRKALLERLPRMRGPATNTPIEQRVQDGLMAAGIGFTTQSLLLERYLVDIEVHQARVIIEADGSQHQLREQKARDALRDAALTAAGYRVFRFTGGEINRDASRCVQEVIDACGLVPDEIPVYDIRTRFAGELHPNWKGGKREFTCDVCGKAFLAQPKHRPGPNYYCTIQCAGAARRGKKLTEEHRAKISAGGTGQKRGPRPPVTAETRAKLSAALKGKPKSAAHVANAAAAQRAANQNKRESEPA
jgi:very-short-patch-repair endonuclease